MQITVLLVSILILNCVLVIECKPKTKGDIIIVGGGGKGSIIVNSGKKRKGNIVIVAGGYGKKFKGKKVKIIKVPKFIPVPVPVPIKTDHGGYDFGGHGGDAHGGGGGAELWR